MTTKYLIRTTLSLLALTLFSGSFLISSTTSAEDESVVDEVNITVPVSCSLSGTGMTSHTATIENGRYVSDIGTTTLKAFCNDNNGFAIYATGYTGNEIGQENSNKLVGTPSTIGNISTGTATSGDISNWSMKLATASTPTPTYPITIDNSFDSYKEVPNEYTKVAHRDSSTDIGENAEGATLTTTYASYISKTQAAGAYSGKVIYTLVHPSISPAPVGKNQIGVIYDGNGLYFDTAQTKETNRVIYEAQNEDIYGYISNTPTILKTNNINSEGTQNGPYSTSDSYCDGDCINPNYVEFEGASQIKLIVRYGLTANSSNISIYGRDGDIDSKIHDSWIDRSGTDTVVIEGDYIGTYMEAWGETNTGYDYGVFIEAYPIYNEPTDNTTYGYVKTNSSYIPVNGAYTETTTWNNYWYTVDGNDEASQMYDEYDVISYLEENSNSLQGTTIYLYSANSYTIIFDSNDGSGSTQSQEVYPYQHTILNESAFTKSHQEVIGWTTQPDGSGDLYDIGYNIYKPLASVGETIHLYALWGDCRRMNICFDGNGTEDSLTVYRESLLSSSIILSASNFWRQNYGFAGWNTKPDGSGINYGPNEELELSYEEYDYSSTKEGIRLYAMWVPSSGDLQNWNGCGNLNAGDVIALSDNRDNNTYAVAKLADNNCWMIENLRLGGSSPISLTTANTQSAGVLPASIESTGASSTGQYVSTQNTDFRNTNAEIRRDYNLLSYGHYYSWFAAINSSKDIPTGDANTSICPAGWHLPHSLNDDSGSIGYLRKSLPDFDKSKAMTKYPNNFLLSGSTSNRGTTGGYWTSTGTNESSYNYAFIHAIDYEASDFHDTLATRSKNIGYSIRCLAGN